MKCAQPGCTGTVVDGYCDVCGLAPVESGTSAPVSSAHGDGPSAATSQSGTTRTIQTGGRFSRDRACSIETPSSLAKWDTATCRHLAYSLTNGATTSLFLLCDSCEMSAQLSVSLRPSFGRLGFKPTLIQNFLARQSVGFSAWRDNAL